MKNTTNQIISGIVPHDYSYIVQLETNDRADRLIHFLLAGFFVTGILLGFYQHTLVTAMLSGTICLLAYYGTRFAFPGLSIYQYILSLVFAVFMMQYYYPDEWLA